MQPQGPPRSGPGRQPAVLLRRCFAKRTRRPRSRYPRCRWILPGRCPNRLFRGTCEDRGSTWGGGSWNARRRSLAFTTPSFLRGVSHLHLTTRVKPSLAPASRGRPNLTPVWFGHEGDQTIDAAWTKYTGQPAPYGLRDPSKEERRVPFACKVERVAVFGNP